MASTDTEESPREVCLLDAFEEAPIHKIGEAARTHIRARILATRIRLEPSSLLAELHRELWPILQYKRTGWGSLCRLAAATAPSNLYLAYECLDRARDRMHLEPSEEVVPSAATSASEEESLGTYFRCLASEPGLHEKYPRLAARGLEALRQTERSRTFHLVSSAWALRKLGMAHAVERRALDELSEAANEGDTLWTYLACSAYMASAGEKGAEDVHRWEIVLSHLLRCPRPYLHRGAWRFILRAAERLGARTARRVAAVITEEDRDAGFHPDMVGALITALARIPPSSALAKTPRHGWLEKAIGYALELADPGTLLITTRMILMALEELPPQPELASGLNQLHAHVLKLLRRHDVPAQVHGPLLSGLARELIRGRPIRAAEAMSARLMLMCMGEPSFDSVHSVAMTLPDILRAFADDDQLEAAHTVAGALIHFLPEMYTFHWKASDAPDRQLFRCWASAARVLLQTEDNRLGHELILRGLMAVESSPSSETIPALTRFAPLLKFVAIEDQEIFLPRILALAYGQDEITGERDTSLRDLIDLIFDALFPEEAFPRSPLRSEDFTSLENQGPPPDES